MTIVVIVDVVGMTVDVSALHPAAEVTTVAEEIEAGTTDGMAGEGEIVVHQEHAVDRETDSSSSNSRDLMIETEDKLVVCFD